MLSQNGTVNFEVNLEFAIPLKLRSTYKNFEFRAKASYFRVFEAEACDSKENFIKKGQNFGSDKLLIFGLNDNI